MSDTLFTPGRSVGEASDADAEVQLQGHNCTLGTAIGTAMVVGVGVSIARPRLGVPDPVVEEDLFLAAIDQTAGEIAALLASGAEPHTGRDDILEAYLAILASPEVRDATVAAIRAGQWAGQAWAENIAGLELRFAAMSDPYLRERGRDVRQLGAEVAGHMAAVDNNVSYPEQTILIGEVGVLDFARAPQGCIVAIVCTHGSTTSHVAMLAGALGIPAVMGVGELPWDRLAGRRLAVDGDNGRVIINPTAAVVADLESRGRSRHAADRQLWAHRGEPALSADGVRVLVCANTGMLGDVDPVLEVGADGIGLYRSEYAFMARGDFPTEAEQYAIYRDVLTRLAPLPVTLRTLDIGGDKPLAYFPIHEDNPALGWRGVRVTLDHPDMFKIQLRAAIAAGAGLDNLRLLLPMISHLGELEACLDLIDQAHGELTRGGLEVARPPVGVMIEVPSAVYLAPALLRRADFVSVGSNDLTQYLLAADRNNERVARLADPLHPAVLAAIDQVARAAATANKPASLCGAMAAEPLAAIALLGMGIDTLSVPTARVLSIKHLVRQIGLAWARSLLPELLTLDSANAVRTRLTDAVSQAGIDIGP